MDYKYAEAADYKFSSGGKSTHLALCLWFFLGAVSAHNFYLGRFYTAVAQLCLVLMAFILVGTSAGAIMILAWLVWMLLDLFVVARCGKIRW